MTRTYLMTTRLRPCTRSAACRWYSAARYWWVDYLRSTLAPQFIKTHLPTRWTFTAVAWLLAFVASTCQFVYNDILIIVECLYSQPQLMAHKSSFTLWLSLLLRPTVARLHYLKNFPSFIFRIIPHTKINQFH